MNGLLRLAIAGSLVILSAAAPAERALDTVLAADAKFGRAARPAADAIGAQFAATVIMTLPQGRFARGRDEAVAAVAASPLGSGSAQWRPSGGGVSADGTHAFTYGYMTVGGGEDGRHAKYLSYWVRTGADWRIVAYKRVPVDADYAGAAEIRRLSVGQRQRYGDHAASLAAAERAFAADAQLIGLGAAFLKYGDVAAINLGDKAIVVGNENIARAVAGPEPVAKSPVDWAPDERVIVAPSGDLGVTVGRICIKADTPGACQRTVAFFTIWQRATKDAPWRYVAE